MIPVLAFAFPFLRLKATSIAFFFLFARERCRLTNTMKPHPRLRKTIKWGGAAVTVLMVVVWVGSGWIWFGWSEPGFGNWFEVRDGIMSCGNAQTGRHFQRDVWASGLTDSQFRFLHRMYDRMDQAWYVALPLWVPALVSLAATVLAWRDAFAHRRTLTHCPKCNYDRAGLAAGAVCPECGERPTVV